MAKQTGKRFTTTAIAHSKEDEKEDALLTLLGKNAVGGRAGASTGKDENYVQRDRVQEMLDKHEADKQAESKTRKAADDLASYAQTGAFDVEKITGMSKALTDSKKESDAAQARINTRSVLNKFSNADYKDNFSGQFGANKTMGRISQDLNAAYSEYLRNPTEDNKAYADTLERLAADFQRRNAAALDEEGAVLPWISKTAAGYLPQLWDQTKAQAQGAVAGGVLGTLIAPGAGTAKGIKAGITAASGIQSYTQMQGAAYRELIEAGLDEKTARAAAQDEAVISALIEMGDTAFDLATLGTGKVISTLFKEGAEKAAKTGVAQSLKKLSTALGKYTSKWYVGAGLNILGEGLEEGAQQAVTIANKGRAATVNTGKLDLAKGALETAWNAATGKDAAARAEIGEAMGEGMKIAAMFGGATALGNAAIERAGNARIQQKAPTRPERKEALNGPETGADGQNKTAAPIPGAAAEPETESILRRMAEGDRTLTAQDMAKLDRNDPTVRQALREMTQRKNTATNSHSPEGTFVPKVEKRAPGFYGEAGREDAAYLDRLAKAAGISIERVPAVEAGDREGWIIGGRAYLSEKTEDPLRMVAKHEVTHYLQEMAGEAYGEFRSYVETIYRDRGTLESGIQARQELYRRNGKVLTAEEALDELAADYAGELLEDEGLIRRLAGEKPGLARQIYDGIKSIIQRLKTALGGEDARQLDRAARLWEQALRETNRAYYQEGKRAADGQERNLFAGERARTADQQALATAKDLEAQDVAAETIRQQTGWFRGADGKWRWEIDDSGMEFTRRGDLNFRKDHPDYARFRELLNKANRNVLGLSEEQLTDSEKTELKQLSGIWSGTFDLPGRVTKDAGMMDKLSDYVDHPALFEAYPELRKATLRFNETENGSRGSYNASTNTITLSSELRNAQEDTLIHEIQHAVQNMEGYAGGSSVDYWKNRQRAGYTRGRNDEAIRAADNNYRTIFENAPDDAKEQIRAINRARLEEDWDAMLSLEEEIYAGPYADLYAELSDADFERRSLRERNEPMTARELYENTAGEIEARDAARRRPFKEQQRRAAAPDTGNRNTVFADGASIHQDAVIRDYHTEEQRRIIREYNAAVDTDLLAYVESIIDQPEAYVPDYRMGKAVPRAVEEVLRLSGVDTAGFDTIIKKTDVQHILKRHSVNGKHDRSMSDPEDIARVKYVLDNFDNAELGTGTKALRDRDGNPAKTIVFSKKINGTYYVVEAVAENKARATRVLTAYLIKSGDAQVTDVQAPVGTSDNGPASTPKYRVAQDSENSKEKKAVKGARELQKQIDRLERQNKRLREQMKRTDVPKANRKAVEKQAGELRKAYSSKIDKAELANRMEKLYESMAARSGGGDRGGLSWEEIHREARAIADDILSESRENVNPLHGELADLRKDLRSRKIYIAQEYRGDLESEGGYNELRKRNMGSLTLSNEGTPVDMVYQELSDQNPTLFPDDIIHPADQLIRISQVAQELKTVEGNPFEQELEHTAEYLAGEIEERFYDTPQEKPTLADKMERKYHEQRIKDQQLNAAKLYNQQKAHEREIRAMEERFREENRKRIENQTTSQRRETIRRHADRLGRKLARPTDKQHVPEEMRGAALALVTYLDTGSSYELAYGTDARYHRVKPGTELGAEITSRTAAARELQAAYKELSKDTSLTIDPDMDDYLDKVAKMGNKRIGDMSREELDTVWRVMQVVEHTISKADDLLAESRYRTVSAMANALRAENGGRKDRGDWAGVLGMADRLLNADMLTPETFFSRLGEAGADVFRQMRRAADRQTMILKEGTDRARKLVKESGVSFKNADKELHTFEASGGKITLSKSQIMELYALSKRKQAMEHIYKGGLKPVEVVSKGRILGGSKPVKVTPSDVAEMVSTLSEKEKALMDGLQKYLSTDLSQHGNEESVRVYGYEKFKEQNYWPIKVSSTEVASDPAKAAGSKTIPGYGMTKALTPKASNAVELRSAIDTFSAHLNQMATYAAWLGTSENVTKLHNFKYQTEDAQVDGTVKEIFEKVYGKSGSKYLENLLADIAQGTKAGTEKSLAEQGLSKFKAAKVGANLRVIIQQPTAILRAMEMVNPKYFAAAKNPIEGWNKAKEHSAIAQWKDWGYFEMDTGRSLRELVTGTEGALDKWKNRFMAPAGAADSIAWGYLWNAVEAETADKHPELEKESSAFYEAAAKRFGEVVDRTQVVDSVLHRTQIMRSSNYANKMLTSFMSEPSKVYNMVVRDLYDLRRAESDTARERAGKQLARSAAALITSFAVNALAQSLVDGLRDDDREKEYWDKVADKWGGNFAENFNPLGYIPYVKDIWSAAQGFTLERSDMEGVADYINSMKQLFKAAEGKGQKTVLAAGVDATSRLGDMLGLPVSNLRRDAGAMFHTVVNSIGGGRLLYQIDKMKYNPETAMSIFQNDLYRAMDTDWNTYTMIYNDIMEELQEQGLTEEKAASKIKGSMEDRMKKSLGVDSVDSLPFRYSAPGENQEFDNFVKAAIEKNTGWVDQMPEEAIELVREFEEQDPEKVTRVSMIVGMGMEQSWAESFLRQTLADSEMKRYTACKRAGVTMKEWADAYSAISGAVYQRTKKHGTHAQVDVETALNKMKGLSNSKKTAIWNSYGWEKQSPWS